MSKNQPVTKKEKIRARNKKIQIILEAERVHEQQRQDLKRQQDPNQKKPLMGGVSRPTDEEVKLDWRTKAKSLRERVHVAKSKARGRWKTRG